ncbi:hypothetical protein CRG98_018832, partial [Punica granatum]
MTARGGAEQPPGRAMLSVGPANSIIYGPGQYFTVKQWAQEAIQSISSLLGFLILPGRPYLSFLPITSVPSAYPLCCQKPQPPYPKILVPLRQPATATATATARARA